MRESVLETHDENLKETTEVIHQGILLLGRVAHWVGRIQDLLTQLLDDGLAKLIEWLC